MMKLTLLLLALPTTLTAGELVPGYVPPGPHAGEHYRPRVEPRQPDSRPPAPPKQGTTK